MPQSTIKQEPIWVRKIEGNQAHVRLRKDFEEVTTTDDEGVTTTHWEYKEVDIVLANRANLVQFIQENFDTVWYSDPLELSKRVLGNDLV